MLNKYCHAVFKHVYGKQIYRGIFKKVAIAFIEKWKIVNFKWSKPINLPKFYRKIAKTNEN